MAPPRPPTAQRFARALRVARALRAPVILAIRRASSTTHTTARWPSGRSLARRRLPSPAGSWPTRWDWASRLRCSRSCWQIGGRALLGRSNPGCRWGSNRGSNRGSNQIPNQISNTSSTKTCHKASSPRRAPPLNSTASAAATPAAATSSATPADAGCTRFAQALRTRRRRRRPTGSRAYCASAARARRRPHRAGAPSWSAPPRSSASGSTR